MEFMETDTKVLDGFRAAACRALVEEDQEYVVAPRLHAGGVERRKDRCSLVLFKAFDALPTHPWVPFGAP